MPGGRRGSALPPSGAHGVKRCPRRSRRFRAPSSLVQLGRSCGIAVTPAPCGGRGWLWVLRFAKARWSSGLAEARGNPPVVRSSPVGRRLGGGKDGDFSKTQYVLRIARGRKPPLKAHFQPSVRPESAPLTGGEMQLRAAVCRFAAAYPHDAARSRLKLPEAAGKARSSRQVVRRQLPLTGKPHAPVWRQFSITHVPMLWSLGTEGERNGNGIARKSRCRSRSVPLPFRTSLQTAFNGNAREQIGSGKGTN